MFLCSKLSLKKTEGVKKSAVGLEGAVSSPVAPGQSPSGGLGGYLPRRLLYLSFEDLLF